MASVPPAFSTPAPSEADRRSGWLVLLAAIALALAVLATLSSLAWYERREALETALDRSELLARVLEDHVTRTVETAGLTLRTLGESVARQPAGAASSGADLQPLLSQALLGLPFMRGVAVLDQQGLVLASSDLTDVGLRLDMGKLGILPADGSDRLLPLLPGRGLADLALRTRSPRAAAVSVLPLLRKIHASDGRPLLMLALINPDALATYQQTALTDSGSEAVLSSYDGQLLTATEGLAFNPGHSLAGHPVFRDWLPAHEHGSYIGAGTMPGSRVVAFRASRTRPLVVLVEQAEAVTLQRWVGNMRWMVGMAMVALLLIVGAAAVVLRSQRARSQARLGFDQAHQQVALRERELSVLLKSVQELIFRTDAAGAIIFVNARWAAVSAQHAEQAFGQRFQDLVDPADRERVKALFSADDRVGVRTTTASVRASDGRLRRFDIAVVPLHDHGEVVGFAGSAVDVTERHIAQQRLQQQLAFTGVLLEISPLPVSVFDIGRRYVTVNRAWEEFTGRQRADVIGTPVGQALPPAEVKLHVAQDNKLLAEGGIIRYETQVTHRDGSRRDMVMTKVLVPDESGGAAGILCTLMDVSEFREAERATREARDVAEEASRSKSEFVANMSHELRTPLQSILGFSELGLMRGREHPKLAGMFTDIHASGQRMLALVNDLLDVSKIDSAVGTFDLERCDLRGLVQSVLRELGPLMLRRQLSLQTSLPASPLSAKVDPVRFQQVIRNVVANAIKFSPEGGELQVRGALSDDGEVHLSVADHGPGIPAAETDKIFEAFVQSSQTKNGAGGTGLGLAICRKIVEIHGGRIYAENCPAADGGGAIFHIFLPVRPPGETHALDTQMNTLI